MLFLRSERALFSRERLVALAEILLIFGVFFAYGAWPIPDVNEQYYVGKAIHFWNPNWLGNDPFLNTPDSHWFFYAAFGLFSFVFSQNSLVWAGRVFIWFATACAWRRLSRALVPKRWFAVLTAAAFAFYLESFHLAGEWIIGGVEGKGFAFPFVFLGLAAFVEGKYNRAWILYGIASAFHVLVGGWAVLASLFAWRLAAHVEFGETLKNARFSNNSKTLEIPGKLGVTARLKRRVRGFLAALWRTLPGLAVGGAISLLGLIPALRLDAGASADVVRESRRIYVYERLSHHLVASTLPWTFLTRFGLLVLAFGLVLGLTILLKRRAANGRGETVDGEQTSETARAAADGAARTESARFFRLEAFVCAAILFALVGLAIDFGAKYWFADPRDAAGLLRYYWYRLSDWAVPLGLVFGVARLGAAACPAFVALNSERRFAAAASWAALGAVVYWLFRTAFSRTAARIAAASAAAGLVPFPKPTEGVSFLATVDALGVAFVVVLLGGAAISALAGRRERPETSESNNALKIKTRGAARWFASGLALWCSLLLLVAPVWRLANFVDLRGTKVIPRSAPPKESIADGWLAACRWVRDNTPPDAIFLVPRGCDSFKWEARRAEAGSWKEIPQDAKSIVRWRAKMERFYATGPKDSPTRWNQPLVVVFLNKGRARILEESRKYGYDYAIIENPPYLIAAEPEAKRRFQEFVDADQVYRNDQYIVLKLREDAADADANSDAASVENAPK